MKKNSGLSLIELIVGISLFSVAILIIGSFYVMSQRVYTKTETAGEITQNARIVSDRLSGELRQAKLILTELPSDPLYGANEIFFQDGNIFSDTRYIKYYQAGSEIKRSLVVYYFSDNPGIYVDYTKKDEFGNPPNSLILEDYVLGEFADQFSIYRQGELIYINIFFKKGREDFQIKTEIFPRNLP